MPAPIRSLSCSGGRQARSVPLGGTTRRSSVSVSVVAVRVPVERNGATWWVQSVTLMGSMRTPGPMVDETDTFFR